MRACPCALHMRTETAAGQTTSAAVLIAAWKCHRAGLYRVRLQLSDAAVEAQPACQLQDRAGSVVAQLNCLVSVSRTELWLWLDVDEALQLAYIGAGTGPIYGAIEARFWSCGEPHVN